MPVHANRVVKQYTMMPCCYRSSCLQDSKPLMERAWRWATAVLQQGLLFGSISGGVFVLLGLLFYLLYGQLFLHETFLHHLVRKDPRHNFSVYYYPVYLDFMPWASAETAAAAKEHVGDVLVHAAGSSHSSSVSLGWLLQLLHRLLPDRRFEGVRQSVSWLLGQLPPVQAARYAVVPQAALLLVLALALHTNQPLCWLLQTMAFVAFNKVSTAQYFVWYYSLMPVALQRVHWPIPRALQVAGTVWVVTQLHWLFWGYMLEFEGHGVHLMLWWAAAVFLVANTGFMCALLGCHQHHCSAASAAPANKYNEHKLL